MDRYNDNCSGICGSNTWAGLRGLRIQDASRMTKQIVHIDMETRSEVDLPKRGLKHYAEHPSTRILMMAYKYGDSPKTDVWIPGEGPIPAFARDPDNYHFYAFNAEFEEALWNGPGVRINGFKKLSISNITCIMALCARYGLPQNLGDAADVLKTPIRKNPEGYALIKHFSIPPFPSYDNSDSRWQRFISYCADDVDAEHGILVRLPARELSEEERWIWEETVRMNKEGLPVDYSAAKQIRRVSEQYRAAHYELLPDLTGGAISKITQTQRIVKYINSRGVDMPDCTASTVGDMLLRDDLPDDVLQLLEMRAAIGMSSIGKYVRFEEMSYNGRAYYNQRYHGATTGRWTGAGIQLLNLPRAKTDDPDAEIAKFFDGSIVEENPIKSARALIRPMVKAPEGKVLVVADYKAIEYVLLEWFAGNAVALRRFTEGFDQYIDQSSSMYNVPYDQVSSEQRRRGKIVVLGCGYGQGASKLVITAKTQWGLVIDEQDANFMVRGYREEHHLVVKMWYGTHSLIVNAIQNPGREYSGWKCKFKVARDHTKCDWLVITLPSGRRLYYRAPFLEPGNFGVMICHWGFNQVIKKWGVKYLIPGRIVENIVQAAARDILINGMKQANQKGCNIIWTVYDEVICEEPDLGIEDNEQHVQRLISSMCGLPEWAQGVPLYADGFWTHRYKKGD